MKNKTKLTAQDLALYLGCEIEWAGDTGYTLAGINTGQSDFNPVGIVDSAGNPIWIHLEDVKPILRPLSDMTLDEAKDLDIIDFESNNSHFGRMAAKVRYLLSRHFDLFGWIAAGLAVDKTKTEKP